MPPKISSQSVLKSRYYPTGIEVGVDEAGRGPLAGPVVAAAVALPEGCSSPLLRDSKTLNLEQRIAARAFILENAQAWAIGMGGLASIAEHNILGATYRAMHEAIDRICDNLQPDRLLIDGNRYKPGHIIPHVCIVKGDGKYQAIAAAGILAKTYRDDIMQMLHAEHPQYSWNTNKGYPTAAHRAAIAEHGATPYHRKGFRLLKQEDL